MEEPIFSSLEEKLEAIGYLAIPGVIGAIEATVPKGKKKQFCDEYVGKYSEEYPYEADKFGKQFRIYLNDTEGCPESLRNQLDGTYGNRINNTKFIDELVKVYGFRFTRERQNDKLIFAMVRDKHGVKGLDAYRKGFDTYTCFIEEIESFVNEKNQLQSPIALKYKEQKISPKFIGKKVSEAETVSAYSSHQMLKLGWSGEEYIFLLLSNRDKVLLKELNISEKQRYTVNWFNDGVQNAAEKYVHHGNMESIAIEKEKVWEDKSVGKGCDIVVAMDTGEEVFIEVKTSRRTYPFFSMTSVEMQEMERRGEQYALIKINNFEKLLKKESPDIITIINPFKRLFHPSHMKEATFVVGGK
jgi:hypothetical protein